LDCIQEWLVQAQQVSSGYNYSLTYTNFS
jgi:hypothetical protein